MKKKKTTLLILGLCIFALTLIGLSYAFWQITLQQTDENVVYTSCLKLEVNWGNKESGQNGFHLTGAYPMTNKELIDDFFPSETPYHFTIKNECNSDVPISINMESIPTTEPQLKDDYVDVILWEDNETNEFLPDSDKVLSYIGSRKEMGSEELKPSYKLTENKVNFNTLIADAKAAYQLHTFKLGANETKQFNLLLFMDYDTPVGGTVVNGEEVQTNNAKWAGKITLNNYEIPKVNIAGKEVELAEEGDGLYAIEHTNANVTEKNGEKVEGWNQTEYRYAGKDPNNYVLFNNEKWRMIGLVNVLIPQEDGSENVEQRVKIIRDESIGEYSWDQKGDGIGSSTMNGGSNDWTDSQLMGMLNDIYYNSTSGNCYKNNGGIGKQTTCNFDGTGDDVQGIKDGQNLIEKNLLWNIGGFNTMTVNTNDMYNYERGPNVHISDNLPWPRSTKWSKNNTRTPGTDEINSDLFNGIGLMYVSDYGYGTSGGTLGREECYKEKLNIWSECSQTDWLKPKSSSNYVITPYNNGISMVYIIGSNGSIGFTSFMGVNQANEVFPTLYLKKDVQILSDENDGSYEKPYQLKLES